MPEYKTAGIYKGDFIDSGAEKKTERQRKKYDYTLPFLTLKSSSIGCYRKVVLVVKIKMYRRLSRYSTARVTGTGFSRVGPTKVKVHQSFLFTESSLRI